MNKEFATYLKWAIWVGVTFFSVYPFTNWFASTRGTPLHLYFVQELSIPFVPQFIWVYFSMNLLLLFPPFFMSANELEQLGKQLIAGTVISGLLFFLVPAELGFERIVPEASPYRQLFSEIFKIDYPHNLVPSLHVIFSTSIILAICKHLTPWSRWLLLIWLGAIMASTILVHQHHIIDVLAGFTLALALRYFISDTPQYGAKHDFVSGDKV
jgi:membrane-associated phospholipid phosphatase